MATMTSVLWSQYQTGALEPTASGLTTSDGREQAFRFDSAIVGRAAWLPQLRERVAELAALRPNWNGYNERQIHSSALSRALGVVNDLDLDREPWLVPLADGRVQLEWHSGDDEVVVEIPPDGSATVFTLIDQVEDEFDLDNTRGLHQLVRAVSGLLPR